MSATYSPGDIATSLRDYLRSVLGDVVGWDGEEGGEVVGALVQDAEYDGVLAANALNLREGAAQCCEMYAGRLTRQGTGSGIVGARRLELRDQRAEFFDPKTIASLALALAASFRSVGVPGYDVALASSLRAGSPPLPTPCTDPRLLGMPVFEEPTACSP